MKNIKTRQKNENLQRNIIPEGNLLYKDVRFRATVVLQSTQDDVYKKCRETKRSWRELSWDQCGSRDHHESANHNGDNFHVVLGNFKLEFSGKIDPSLFEDPKDPVENLHDFPQGYKHEYCKLLLGRKSMNTVISVQLFIKP